MVKRWFWKNRLRKQNKPIQPTDDKGETETAKFMRTYAGNRTKRKTSTEKSRVTPRGARIMIWDVSWPQKRTLTWKRGSGRSGDSQRETPTRGPGSGLGQTGGSLGCAKRPLHCVAMSAPLVRTHACPEPNRKQKCRETDNKFHYLFQVQRKETDYYLPTCIECAPVFYCKRIVVAL